MDINAIRDASVERDRDVNVDLLDEDEKGMGFQRQVSGTPPGPFPVAPHLSSSTPVNAADDSTNFLKMSRDKKFTVITFCLANFCTGAFYSLLAPFFPNEAAKKGMSPTVTGLVFGLFELVLMLMAPVYGNFMTKIGAKFMYVTGLMICGSGAILFGFLDGSPDGTIFIVMCFLVRFVEAQGAAALITSSFAIMAFTFPQNVAAMLGSLELFSGLGMMVGPPIGGALYQLGGYKLPFISSGAVLVLVGFTSIWLLPSPGDIGKAFKGSILSLLTIPVVPVVALLLVAGASGIGLIDVSLSVFLQKYKLTPVLVGLVFLVGPGMYALSAPLWGWIADSRPQYSRWLMMLGFGIGGVAFLLMGPAPFLNIFPKQPLWLVLVSLGLMGLGIGSVVIAFQIFTTAARGKGHPESLDTYGKVSGIFNVFFSMGAFIGPLGGGYLSQVLGFEWAAAVTACFALFVTAIFFLFEICRRCCQRADTTVIDASEPISQDSVNADETTSLLAHNRGSSDSVRS